MNYAVVISFVINLLLVVFFNFFPHISNLITSLRELVITFLDYKKIDAIQIQKMAVFYLQLARRNFFHMSVFYDPPGCLAILVHSLH